MDDPHKTSITPDQAAAHELLCELRTRISTIALPYQYGVEAAALESLWEVFAHARAAMKNHPGCVDFARITTDMLNVDLRPITSKWHRAHLEGRLKSRDGADEFRSDLERAQQRIGKFAKALQMMAYGTSAPDSPTPPAVTLEEISKCFAPVTFGIGTEALIDPVTAGAINKDEATAIKTRRAHYAITTAEGMDAIGLALSGGGIRSATFCLGVTQVLAERNMLKDVDFLSTVSGGGYVGTFLTMRLGHLLGGRLQDVGKPHGPDSEPVRYLRQHAKYLAASNLKEQWSMVTAAVAGMVLNWTAPVFVIGAVALLGVWISNYTSIPWGSILAVLIILNVLALILYAGLMRHTRHTGGILLAVATASTLLTAFCWLMTLTYDWFVKVTSSPGKFTVAAFLAAAVAACPTIVRFIPILKKPTIREWVLKVALWTAGLLIPIGVILLAFVFYTIGKMPGVLWGPLQNVSGFVLLSSIVALLGFIALFLLNINLTGPHRLYRDKLARTFVQSNERETNPVALATVNPSNTAPYHLINATINLPSSISVSVRERKSDFFLFSKHWCGAPSINYEPTSTWKINNMPLDIATSMAVSGAAASPYMGLASMPSLTALMTFLNVRLGVWIKRPNTKSLNGTPFRLFVSKVVTYFSQKTEIDIYVVQMRSKEYGDPLTSRLLKAISVGLRFRFLLLEEQSDFSPEHLGHPIVTLVELKPKIVEMLGQIDLILRDAVDAELQEPELLILIWGKAQEKKVQDMMDVWEKSRQELYAAAETILNLTDEGAFRVKKEAFITTLATFCKNVEQMNKEFTSRVLSLLASQVKKKIGHVEIEQRTSGAAE